MENIDSLNAVVQPLSEVLKVVVQSPEVWSYPFTHPLLSGLVGAVAGAVLTAILAALIIPWFLKRKEDKQQGIKELIKVTDEVNVALSCFFGKIREPNISMDIVDAALMNAFESRLRYRIMAVTYFPKKSITEEYDEIIAELDYLRRSITKYEQTKKAKKKIEIDWNNLRTHIENLRNNWNVPIIEDEENKNKLKNRNVTHPYDIYLNWNQVIWDKFQQFIEGLLCKSLKSKSLIIKNKKANGNNKKGIRRK